MSEQCKAQGAGYGDMFGVYCDRPAGHDGLHCDGYIEWRWIVTERTPRGRIISERHDCGRIEGE